MPAEISFNSFQENLDAVLDRVIDQQQTVVVRRKGARDVAIIPATELEGLLETAHLLSSPRNARRLLAALKRAKSGVVQPSEPSLLRNEMQLASSD
jgi:antitoxin YefM